MAKVSQKKNLSSIQVLKTLQVLLQGNFTMKELIQKLNKEEKDRLFNNSVISKYINTCRYCGIDIHKIHNKYFVTSMPFGLDLTINEIDLIENLQNIIKNEMGSKNNKIFNIFIEKLNRFSNKKLTRVEKETFQVSIELFEGAIRDKRKVRLMYKNKDILDCTPLNIVENKGRTYFHILKNTSERMIDFNRVSGIEVLKDKFIGQFNEQSVIFELKGELAQKYNLRENETLVNHFDGKRITVSNRGDVKEALLHRLLRYDDKCEIINPKPYRDEMKQIIEATLKNYES